MDLDRFVEQYPRLYHMAGIGTWPKIREIGLLSTAAVLDRYGITGVQRQIYEESHRPEMMRVGTDLDYIVLRDQKPMAPDRLVRALNGTLSPEEWYRWLNGRTFFWAEERRLYGLLGARPYRNLEHDVLTLDTRRIVEDYADQIWLCHMNSGNTFPMPHARSIDIFKRILDYPVNVRTGRPIRNVVEVVVDYQVNNVLHYTIEVRRMKRSNVLAQIL